MVSWVEELKIGGRESCLCKRNKNLSIDEIIWSLVILCIQILESGFLRKRKIGGREWTLVSAREMRIFPSMRYYLVSYNFMYRDFGKWFLGGKEKLVEENLFIDEREY